MKKAMFAFATAALCAVATPAAAQESATVNGRVTNAQSGRPEPGVLIRIDQLNVGTATDQEGRYRLVVPGARAATRREATISASRAGLAPSSRPIRLAPGARATHDFQLANSVLSEDVVIDD